MKQRFKTTEVLRLDVQGPWSGLPNLVDNPSGRVGASGWYGNPSNTPDEVVVAVPGPRLSMTKTTTSLWVATYELPIPAPVAGTFVRAWIRRGGGTSGLGIEVHVNFLNGARSIGTFTPSSPSVTANGAVAAMPKFEVPLSARYIRVRVQAPGAAIGNFLEFDQVTLVMGTSAEVDAASHEFEAPWTNVLGPSHEVNIERTELNVGVLSAVIRDSTLDPAQHDLIRPGRGVRAVLIDGEEDLFRGEVLSGRATYELRNKMPDTKRTRIELTATDALTTLAATKRAEGVATVAELPYVLEGTGVPYSVNGVSGGVAPDAVTVVAVNDNASAIDQIVLTRDSVLGYAWLDRSGVVRVWDRASIPAAVAASYDEDDYTGLDVDFDLERCINTVSIKVQSTDPVTGEAAEVIYGPYVDVDSARVWRPRAADFTVHGLDAADLDAYAATILAANATPEKRINSVTMPLLTTAALAANGVRDLYDLVTTSNDRSGITQSSRVVSVTHRITPSLWTLTLGFGAEGGVAPPQVIPAPGSSGGLTQAERLRPVGEVTMFYGTTAAVPAGWLVCDGTVFSSTEYPKLAALLGGTLLPNLVDRMPVGAGVKALGTSGGSSTKMLIDRNVPPVTFTATGSASGGTTDNGGESVAQGGTTGRFQKVVQLNGGASTLPLDVMPPWRALYFIIRAV